MKCNIICFIWINNLFQNVPSIALCVTMRQSAMSVPKVTIWIMQWNVKVSLDCSQCKYIFILVLFYTTVNQYHVDNTKNVFFVLQNVLFIVLCATMRQNAMSVYRATSWLRMENVNVCINYYPFFIGINICVWL